MKKLLEEHNNYSYDVVTKHDKYIKGILSNPDKSQPMIVGLSDKQITNLLSFANNKYRDSLVKLIFDVKKENISDYLLIYLLENSYDINEMSNYFAQFIPKERINDVVAKSRLKASKIEENLRTTIREILSEIYK